MASQDAIKHFVETHYYLGTEGRLAQMLTTKDQGAFLAWLLVADHEQIDTVRYGDALLSNNSTSQAASDDGPHQ